METLKITQEYFTQVKNDINGNPRYVLHFLYLIKETESTDVFKDYDLALSKAKKIGGKAYRGKDFGGGIVFQACNIYHAMKKINELLTNNN